MFSSYSTHWQRLNNWLQTHRALWQPTPFTQPSPGWIRQWPTLHQRVEGFDDEGCQYFEQHPVELAELLSSTLPSLAEAQALTAVPELSDNADGYTLAEVRARDMPGRKRLQAGAFTAAVQPLTQPIIDWCCGKGHLARTLLPHGERPIVGLEWNPALVDDGNRLADKFGDAVTIQCQNVMAEDLTLPDDVHGVALHACGDLHRRLMARAAGQQWPRLSIAPCCFHLSEDRDYRLLSQAARQCPDVLRLASSELKLAMEETVTAPARIREQVQRFSQWRLGFDGLQRWLRGVDEYLPVPSHPARIGRGDFPQFCRWAADKKHLDLPDTVDFSAWEALGVQRLRQVRRHELIRHLFRRPLELWLVLDYALFLQEQGYRVRVGTFCEPGLTPRNLLLDAVMDSTGTA